MISCGGGVPLRQGNVDNMRACGVIVLLTAAPETIFSRVRHNQNRPLLAGNMNVEYIAQLMEQRRARYQAAARLPGQHRWENGGGNLPRNRGAAVGDGGGVKRVKNSAGIPAKSVKLSLVFSACVAYTEAEQTEGSHAEQSLAREGICGAVGTPADLGAYAGF